MIPRELTSAAAAHAASSERTGRLAPDVLAELARADLFRLCVPRSLGGREADAVSTIGAIETLAEADGAAGWCLMIAATSGIVAGRLPADAARAVFGSPGAACGGVFAPKGRAVAGGAGYAVSGRWPFASGVLHCTHMLAGCVLVEGEQPRLLPSGAPDVHLAVLGRDQLRIEETWSVTGLRATGSHDMLASGALVERELAVSLFTGLPVADGTLYRFPLFGLLAAGVAAVALGIARGALGDFSALAAESRPSMSRRLIAEHPAAQATAASAWARFRAARALLREAVEDAWEEAGREQELSLARRAGLRLAATHAVRESTAVVSELQHAAGGRAIYTSSPLERRFRDVHTLRAHMIVAPSTWELAGRVLLGADVDATML